MENTVTDSVESTETTTEATGIMGVTGTEPAQPEQNVAPEVDNSYDSDYKDDYSVPTEATPEEIAEQNVPEKTSEQLKDEMFAYVKENYEVPDKFKDIGSLINSYKHLEGKMGSMKGAPETYQINDDIYDSFSEDMLGSLTDTAREMGLDNDGMNKMLQAASKQATLEADANWEMEKHKLGQYADEELSDAVSYLNANFTPEVSEQLQGMVSTAAQFKALKEAVMSSNKQSAPAQNQNQPVQQSDSDIQKMLFAKDEFGNLKMETDSQYAAKVNGMMSNNW